MEKEKTINKKDLLYLLFSIAAILFIGLTQARADVGQDYFDKLTDSDKSGYDNCLILHNGSWYYYILYNGSLTVSPNASYANWWDITCDKFKYGDYNDSMSNVRWYDNKSSTMLIGTGQTSIYSNCNIYDDNGNIFFQQATTLKGIIQPQKTRLMTILSLIKSLVPLLIVLLVSWIGFRKSWNFLKMALKTS